MKNTLTILILLFFFCNSGATDTDTTKNWKTGGLLNLTFSQVSLTNWAAGGQSSYSISTLSNLSLTYSRNKTVWENTMDFGLGIQNLKDESTVKTDDRIEINSKLGYKATGKIFYTALFSTKTQLFKGYNYPNDSVKKSDFMSPAYFSLSLGMDYKPDEYTSLLLSPLASKVTYVNDTTLSAVYGLEAGEKTLYQMGALLKFQFEKEIIKNITLKTKLDLYSNYIKHPENIDADWEVLITMNVNKFLAATISTHLIYDDDIIIISEEGTPLGPRIQFKEIFGLSVNYKF